MNRIRMSINNLFGLIPPPLKIQVHPELFRFSMGTKNIQLETTLNIQMVNGKYEVHSAGAAAFDSSDIIRIDLFRNTTLPDGIDRTDAFVAYLRQAIQKFIRKRITVRPIVKIFDAHTLDDALLGYQYFLLRTVLMESGAREVRFE